jgi:UDP-3-O-acyl-N-acetylglucosamine deacetylase
VAHRAGHALHTAFAARILEDVDAWKIVEGDERNVAQPVGVPVPVAVATTGRPTA